MKIKNVVILAAGRGKRFADAGFQTSKPLLEVSLKGRTQPVIAYNLASLTDAGASVTVVGTPSVCRFLRTAGYEIDTVKVTVPRPSSVHSALLSLGLLPPDEPVLFLDSDHVYNIPDFDYLLEGLDPMSTSGVIASRIGPNAAMCDVETDTAGRGFRLKEKVGISPLVVTGGYYFRSAREFESAAMQFIAASELSKANREKEIRMSDIVNSAQTYDRGFEIREIPPEAWISVGTPDEFHSLTTKDQS